MHIFSRENGKIQVYELIPIFEKLYKYRKKLLPNATIMEAKTNYQSNNRVLENCTNYLTHKEINSYQENKYHVIEKQFLQNQEYVYGLWSSLFDQNKVVKVVKNDKVLEYLLLTSNSYENVQGKNLIYMPNIICINKDIFLLQLMLQDEILELNNENIDNQLKLFRLEQNPIYTIKEHDITMLEKMSLIKEEAVNLNQKLDISQKILTKVK